MRCVSHIGGMCMVVFVWLLKFGPNAANYLFFSTASAALPSNPFLFLKIIFVTYEAFAITGLLSHIMAVFSDPGVIKSPMKPPPGFNASLSYCKKCKDRWKPPRAHHCSVCKVCIFRMDHHCLFINNCIGLLNLKIFILFLLYSGIEAIMIIVTFFYAVFCYLTIGGLVVGLPLLAVMLVFSVGSAVAVFGIYGYLSDQVEAIKTNSTLVENLQHTRGKIQSFEKNVLDVFGEVGITWFFPLPASITVDLTDPVFECEDEKIGKLWKQSFSNDNDKFLPIPHRCELLKDVELLTKDLSLSNLNYYGGKEDVESAQIYINKLVSTKNEDRYL